MKVLLLLIPLILFNSCVSLRRITVTNDGMVNEVNYVKDSKIDTVKFLWRDSINSIIINKEYCKTMSETERAAVGFIATFIGNECYWDGAYSDNRDNLKCEILTALDLGYQCSEEHLGFLRKWFKNDLPALQELEICPTTPNSSTIQDTFDEISVISEGNQIRIHFIARGFNIREQQSWNFTQTDHFEFHNDNIKVIKREKSDFKFTPFDASLDDK